MTHPFDAPHAACQVLVNAEQQHSLWPHELPVPDGWLPAYGPDTRDACIAYVDAHWHDMRPASIRPTG